MTRPNTIPPNSYFEIGTSALEAMNDVELIQWADEFLGLVIPLETSRQIVLSRIMNCAIEAIS